VLFAMALRLIRLRLVVYLRRSMGIPALAAAAMAASAGVRWAADPLPPVVRLLLAAATLATVFFVLLAYLEGISPRAIARALRDES